MAFTRTEMATAMGLRRYGEDHVKYIQPVDTRGTWFPVVREPYGGAWQKNDEWSVDTVVSHPTVYSCLTLIANDIGKLRHKLVEVDDGGIWEEIDSAAFSPVLRKPNRYQNHIQFKQWWIMSKLMRGNTYAIKQRDNRGVVTALYILDPCRVQVLVSESGDIFYQLGQDNISGLDETSIQVPASEIIHDRMNCLFHPLVGTSPLFAAGVVANIGLKIQSNTAWFFGNSSNPGGVLVAPGAISNETATRLKDYWDTNYGGANNAGKIAVLGDGLSFEPMRMSAVDSQMIEILKWTDEKICSVFHVPPYKVGVGTAPAYNNIEALNQDYYSQCLQSPIEEYETCMDEGLGLDGYMRGIELDLDGLIRMDSATQTSTLVSQINGSLTTINEARKKLSQKPVEGGDSIWMQQQDTSLAALAERDRNPQNALPAIAAPVPVIEDDPEETEEQQVERFLTALNKTLEAA